MEAGARVKSAIPETARVPAGTLDVRDPEGRIRALESPSLELGRTPGTNGQYAEYLLSGRTTPPPWWDDPNFAMPSKPAVGITWDEAVDYCGWLSGTAGGRWRLPTEEEWEFAACGGLTAPRTAWGDEVPQGEIPEVPLAGPWEVGRGTPNGYGLYDMGTIVHEWCQNWHEAERAIRRKASRGGSWRHRVRWSSPAARSSLPPDYRYSDYGFRVVKESR